VAQPPTENVSVSKAGPLIDPVGMDDFYQEGYTSGEDMEYEGTDWQYDPPKEEKVRFSYPLF
jgi:hypothetical protein